MFSRSALLHTRKLSRFFDSSGIEKRFERGSVFRGAVTPIDQPAAAAPLVRRVFEHFSAHELAAAAQLFRRTPIAYVDSLASEAAMQSAPAVDDRLAEVVVMGRSNTGKSSLLNSVLGESVARVSGTPGRTAMANRFRVGELFVLIDVPGYGYAKTDKKQRYEWTANEFALITQREPVALFLVLIDARRGLAELDRERLRLLQDAQRSYQVVLTKSDKLKPRQLQLLVAELESELEQRFSRAAPFVLATFVRKEAKYGVEHVRASMLDQLGVPLTDE